MDDSHEKDRRDTAAKYHAEYRQRALDAPETTARWMLAAAAAGALACLNGIISPEISPQISRILAYGVSGFVMSMSLTGAGMSFSNAADTDDMIFWEKLDRPLEDVPVMPETDPLTTSALKKRNVAGKLLPLGNLTFMFTALIGAWAINNALTSLDNCG